MFNKIKRILNTLMHLKFIQVYYQLYYRFLGKTKYQPYTKGVEITDKKITSLDFRFNYLKTKVENEEIIFNFLNLSKKYSLNTIDWNESEFGKLWTYHLNYFEYLYECDDILSAKLIDEYIKQGPILVDGLEPYPTSLRIMNWIKYVLKGKSASVDMLRFLRSDVERLNTRLEFHIQANHLLENACAMYIASIFFKDKPYHIRARKLLIREVKEQFFKGCVHYEGSVMYHTVIVDRLIDVYTIAKSLSEQDEEVLSLLKNTIECGVGYMEWMNCKSSPTMFNDGNLDELIPFELVNNKIVQLGLSSKSSNFEEYGYYKLEQGTINIIADYSDLLPSYQPGHAHADTFTFTLSYNGSAVVVNNGVSTYQKNRLRDEERSTYFHNTIMYKKTNSSDTWEDLE